MSFLAPKLKHLISIKTAVDDPNDFGGNDRSYELVLRIWAGVKPISSYIQAIRGKETTDFTTHEFIVRWNAVKNLGKEFTSAFGDGFNNSADINVIKSDYFIFLESGSTVKGRRFRIEGARLDEDNHEFIKIQAKEFEEAGTGWIA